MKLNPLIGAVFVFLALLLTMPLTAPEAQASAACPAGAGTTRPICDQGEAWADCSAKAPTFGGFGGGANVVCKDSNDRVLICNGANNSCSGSNSNIAFYYKKCSDRPEETGWKGSGAAGTGSVCHNGCAYDGSVFAGSPTGRLFTANGQMCKNSDIPPPETATPGDGDGGGGGEIPGDGDGGGGGDGGGDPGGGGDGGGGNGDGDGDGGGDGGGGTGPGNGDGDGDGDGDGEGSTLPEGEMWKAPKDTVQSVFDDFYDKAKKTKMVDGVTKFMKISGNGSCPTFTVSATKWWASMTYSAHCSGDFLALLQLCGYVIFAIAAYAAVRISLT